MPEVALPNGMTVSCLQKHDFGIVNAEVQTYFDHGIAVEEGNTIIDVGANIGLFALAAWARSGGSVRVHCFEPVAPIFYVLQKNLNRYDGEAMRAYPYGLSNRAGTVEFAYYPSAPVLSTEFPDPEADHQEVKEATLTNIIHMPEAPVSLHLLKWLPAVLREAILDTALKRTLRYQTVQCELKTLSAFIREQGIERIDLLKIDAEKAELDIFYGIEPDDWPRIRQVVVDVHDMDGRLETVLGLLRAHGLTEIVVEQPPTLHESSIYTLLATRG